jgi:hypothetical protein
VRISENPFKCFFLTCSESCDMFQGWAMTTVCLVIQCYYKSHLILQHLRVCQRRPNCRSGHHVVLWEHKAHFTSCAGHRSCPNLFTCTISLFPNSGNSAPYSKACFAIPKLAAMQCPDTYISLSTATIHSTSFSSSGSTVLYGPWPP